MAHLNTHVDLYLWIAVVVAVAVAYLRKHAQMDNQALLSRLQALNTKEDAILSAIQAPSDPATDAAILDAVSKSEQFATDAEAKLGITPQ
jgi:hypothetical protein